MVTRAAAKRKAISPMTPAIKGKFFAHDFRIYSFKMLTEITGESDDRWEDLPHGLGKKGDLENLDRSLVSISWPMS